MKYLLYILVLFATINASAQNSYKDSLTAFIKDYVEKHEVVKEKDRGHLHFYDVDEHFRIATRFEKVNNSPWFKMESSGAIKRMYRVYGKVHFNLHDTAVTLSVYQSQDLLQMDKYREHLFIPFTDATSGTETYEGGRYFDLTIRDINDNMLVVDFNKAYNPYCAYVSSVYNCPIPPGENRLPVAIKAGEKAYGKAH
jgi:uncharacterized protein (DUF1684 family)